MKQKTILLVEDERIIGLDIQKTLLELGYSVPPLVSSGDEAIQKAEELNPDLILMDIALSGDIDGIDVINKIREKLDIPVIYLTAHANDTTFKRARETEPYGYLVKPVGKNDLYMAIETSLHRHSMQIKLRESEERYHEIFDNSPDVIYHLNERGEVITVNSSLLSFFGYEDDSEIVGKSFVEFIHPDDRDSVVCSFIEAIKAKRETTAGLTFRLLKRSGEPVWFELHSRMMFDENGNYHKEVGILRNITDLMQAKESLRESEEKYRNLIENLNDIVYEIDGNAKIIYVSPNIEEISGYTQEKLLGRSYFDLLHPDENMEERKEHFKKVLSGEPLINEYRFLAKDGSPVWVRNSGRTVVHGGTVTGVQGILMDITEKKMAEEALRKSEEKYRLLADNMSDNIWVLNTDLRFTYVSPSVSRIVGYTDREYLSMRLEDILTPDSLELTMRTVEEELAEESRKNTGNEQRYESSGGYRTLEVELIHKNGHRVWGEITAKFLRDDSGKVTGILGSTRNITERRRAEEQLRSSLREKEILLKEIHHRVKNNFQVITSLLRLQRKSIKDVDLHRVFVNSENRIRAMALVHERLYQSGDFARIDFSDYISLMAAELFQTHHCDPDRVKLQINAGSIQLGIDQAIPCGLIINELVSNALKHAFPDELEKKGRIEISLHENGAGVELTVRDDGVGLPETIDITKSDSLGLEIVHLLAEVQLRGEYGLSRENGTEFTVRFKMEE